MPLSGTFRSEVRSKVPLERTAVRIRYLLGLAQAHLPFPFVVTGINDAVPDCEGLDPTTGRRIAIELEVRSRNFLSHRHPIKGCDYIVCWEDDWKDARAHVREKIVCLRDLFRTKSDLARKFIDKPRPESLRAELAEIRGTNPKAHAAVTHLLRVGLPQVQLRIPAITLDDTGTKHFSIKYGSGKGVLGVHPAGKLVAGSVVDMVAHYGEPLRVPTRKLRDVIAEVRVLTSQDQCPALLDALEGVMHAIARTEAAAGLAARRRGQEVPAGRHNPRPLPTELRAAAEPSVSRQTRTRR